MHALFPQRSIDATQALDDNTLRTVVAQARIDHLPEKRVIRRRAMAQRYRPVRPPPGPGRSIRPNLRYSGRSRSELASLMRVSYQAREEA